MANKWRCGGCGYRLEADVPPEECPGCGEKCDFVDDNPYVGAEAGGPLDTAATPGALLPQVVPEKCTGCRKCIEVCPLGAIAMREEVAFIDHDLCDGDAICVPACPEGAIVIPA